MGHPVVVAIISAGNSTQQSADVVELVERGLERPATINESSVTATTSVSADCPSVPHLLRSKSSNCFQRPSGAGADSERRFFLPSIDRTGSVSAQRRPATSGEVRLNNERQENAAGDVPRPPRSSAVTVWNSLTSLSPAPNSSSADLPHQTRGNFIPTPPPRKNSTGNN